VLSQNMGLVQLRFCCAVCWSQAVLYVCLFFLEDWSVLGSGCELGLHLLNKGHV
jgi:hypothetical protein